MTIKHAFLLPVLSFSLLTVSSVARAQEASAEDADDQPKAGAPEEEPAKVKKKPKAEADADDSATEDKDEPRFRGGISGGGGALIWNGNAAGLGGIDGRVGVQIMDLLGVYAQPHIALGYGSGAFAGSLGGTVVVDFTFIDRIFVGVGGGGGLVQFGGTEAAGMLHVRAGGYPALGFGDDGIRRKGLMIGADVIVHFASGQVLPSPMVSIGYEAF